MNTIIERLGFGPLADIPVWHLHCQGAVAVVSSYGAHLLSYRPSEDTEVLYLSETAQWQPTKPIRGGVPICWPWFGPCSSEFNPTAAAQPNHGLVRTKIWQLQKQYISAEQVSVCFSIELTELPHITAPITLNYQVSLSADALEIELSCVHALPQQAALHSYFAVSDCQQSWVEPLPLQYFDKVLNQTVTASSPAARFQGETDRIYPQPAAQLNLQRKPGELLVISQQGQDAAVIWNPGAVRAAMMGDIACDSWSQFVCVESAALDKTAKPLRLSQRIQLIR